MSTDDDLIETIKLRLDMCEQDDDVFNDPDEAVFLTQVLARIRKLESQLARQPIETAPKDGMSLRDYFAAKAMQGLLAAQVHGFNDQPAKGPFASMAYEMADAMIAARKEKP